MVGELGLKARFFLSRPTLSFGPFLKKYWNSITVKKSEIRDLTHFCYFDNKTQNTKKMQNLIWKIRHKMKNFPNCFFHFKKIFFGFSGHSKFTTMQNSTCSARFHRISATVGPMSFNYQYAR